MSVIDRPLAARRRWRIPGGVPLVVALAMGFMALMFVVMIFAQLIQPYAFEHIDLMNRMTPPLPLEGADWRHPLGTDKLGRDLFSRLLIGAQTSMLLALLGTCIGAVLGIALGFFAAHRGGLLDEAIMTLVDFQAAMPWFIIALAILAFMGNSMLIFILIMGLYGWEAYARVTRGLVLGAREQGYALAVRGLGAKPRWIYLRHVLPNISGPLLVQLTINFPNTILFETSLSFLGLGIRPPMTSLGQMLGEGRDYLINAWWLAVIPGAVIFFTTLSMSVLGDWLRARLDPSLEN
ncbi:MAG: ABC transporter permease [Confluentimicrobium sp.]|jgi:peptide/nickel transport system permease protein|uniref:Peptide/nickel transport system permease protein n=1 Tax=Actibacterium naphthalenivorans TaxID=1614693 RepID=A0A840CBG8_9RHOB|nr:MULTISPECIES: ABC transporter permease [Actibacterium]ALG89041.1 peptide ABC transporter permease [Actibacterium sp. EMB200-NS6]MBB4021402.1 peptide/nickel transport system permease protein [Actibacterium naphthalenivorans]MBC56861.1 ABC transporter permease [Actibacterium sp.]MDY6859176.1 ABC transporter permease [Pseudomonadota bacterium]|tara:strand:+ start:1012 stop:1890 length:879 start_codon:yes stop_codon:yes gene_type:complete